MSIASNSKINNLIFIYFIKYSIHEILLIVKAITNRVTTVLNAIITAERL